MADGWKSFPGQKRFLSRFKKINRFDLKQLHLCMFFLFAYLFVCLFLSFFLSLILGMDVLAGNCKALIFYGQAKKDSFEGSKSPKGWTSVLVHKYHGRI